MLSEICQTLKDRYCIIPLHDLPRTDKFIETENKREVTGGWVKGGRGSYFLMGTEFLLGMMKMF